MNVEDSYEGAIRRLARLGQAGLNIAPPDDTEERLRDLEELATLACDDNERLKVELASAHREAAVARQEAAASRQEADRLRLQVMTLQHQVENAPPVDYPPKSSGRGPAFFLFIIAVGAAAAALYVMRPWEHARTAVAAATPVSIDPTPAAPPVVTPPPAPTPPVVATPPVTTPPVAAAPTIPKAAPAIPTVAPAIPKAAPAVPKVAAPAPAKAKHHKSAAAKHHKSAAHKKSSPASKSGVSNTDDPLGGIGL